MLNRVEDGGTSYTVKYFYDGGLYAEIIDATWVPNKGEIILVANAPKIVDKIIWDLWNFEIFVYLTDKEKKA